MPEIEKALEKEKEIERAWTKVIPKIIAEVMNGDDYKEKEIRFWRERAELLAEKTKHCVNCRTIDLNLKALLCKVCQETVLNCA
jgi:hypothetical protein